MTKLGDLFDILASLRVNQRTAEALMDTRAEIESSGYDPATIAALQAMALVGIYGSLEQIAEILHDQHYGMDADTREMETERILRENLPTPSRLHDILPPNTTGEPPE